MKKVDILFLYETKVREIENICLLKYELERRGYSVAILNTWNEIGKRDNKIQYDAEVVVTHAMYHDGIYEFVLSIVGKANKIVNMQCEQIGTIGDEANGTSRFVLSGNVPKQCMNICWGNMTLNRLKNKSHIDDKHLCLAGNIALDFCRKKFKGYYISRDNLCEQYHIQKDNKLNLFISSFSYINLPDRQKEESEITDKDRFIDFSVNSFKGIIKWFEELIENDNEQVIIYRPHPAESDNIELSRLHEKYPKNFYIIDEKSVKQWISVVDRVYTWYSTAAVEATMFGIPCAVLRPVEILPSMENQIYEGASFICDYKQFRNTVYHGITNPFDISIFNECYLQQSEYAYVKVADAIEKVYKDDTYKIEYEMKKEKTSIIMSAKKIAHRFMVAVCKNLPDSRHLFDKYRVSYGVDSYTEKLMKRNMTTAEEIDAITGRIRSALLLCNGKDEGERE